MLASLARFLIDPFNIFLFLLLGCCGAWLFQKKYWFKRLAIFSAVWFLLISTPLIPNAVIRSLEDRYPPINMDELNRKAEYHILILGGGHGYDDRLPASTLLSENTLRRLNEGIRLHRQLPNSKLVLSGFSTVGGFTGAEMLQQAALQLGVDEEAIILQKSPINTYQEAEVYARRFGNTHPLILVTSAVHMPRAMLFFEHFGIQPVPSPTDYELTGSRRYRWLGWPEPSNIERLRSGIKEYTGILVY